MFQVFVLKKVETRSKRVFHFEQTVKQNDNPSLGTHKTKLFDVL